MSAFDAVDVWTREDRSPTHGHAAARSGDIGGAKKAPPERGLSLRRNVEPENRTCGFRSTPGRLAWQLNRRCDRDQKCTLLLRRPHSRTPNRPTPNPIMLLGRR